MTTEERMAGLERNMENLKRQVRRMKWAVLILGVALVVGIGWRSRVLSPSPAHGQNPRIVEAEEFRVVDENGKVRALLRMWKNGPVLDLLDENGKFRAGLGVLEESGPSLSLFDRNEKFRAGLNVSEAGPAGLSLLDQNGMLRVGLNVHNGGAGLGLFDEKGRTLWSAP